MNRVKAAVVAVLALLVLTFVIQNTEVVGVRFLFWELSMSRVILILVTALAGFVCGFLLAKISGRSATS